MSFNNYISLVIVLGLCGIGKCRHEHHSLYFPGCADGLNAWLLLMCFCCLFEPTYKFRKTRSVHRSRHVIVKRVCGCVLIQVVFLVKLVLSDPPSACTQQTLVACRGYGRAQLVKDSTSLNRIASRGLGKGRCYPQGRFPHLLL